MVLQQILELEHYLPAVILVERSKEDFARNGSAFVHSNQFLNNLD